MGVRAFIKAVFEKFKRAGARTSRVFSVPKDAKNILSYFVCRSYMYDNYRRGIEQDHEPDEIKEAMLCYMPIVRVKAKLLSRDMQSGEAYLDRFEHEDREAWFFGALDVVRKHPEELGAEYESGAYGELELIEMYLAVYGKFSDMEKRLLEAEVSNRRDIADLYRKFL